MKITEPTPASGKKCLSSNVILLAVLLALLFWKSFLPGYVHFANDGPLGQQVTAANQFPGMITGVWTDQNSIGNYGGAYPPSVSFLICWVFGPVGVAKFLAPVALLIMGVGAWTCFRQMHLSPLAATLGALAVTLNSGLFSNACWGVATQQIAMGMVFFALGLVMSITPATPPVNAWARIALAGLAIGMNVMEAADIGAIFSVFVALFVVYHSWFATEGTALTRAIRGPTRAGVIAMFALFIATYTFIGFVKPVVAGKAGMGQDVETKAKRWSQATQWSFPKRETASYFISGIFGYKMDTPNDMEMFPEWFEGGSYWGRIGGDPSWDRYFSEELKAGDPVRVYVPENPSLSTAQAVRSDGNITLPTVGDVNVAGLTRFQLQQKLSALYSAQSGPRSVVENPGGNMRFSSGGIYAGTLVVLVAFWAALQSFRKKDSVFSPAERKLLWFWVVLAVVGLVLGYGRFTPFYRLVYALPYFSTIRNPAKFLAVFNWAVLVLFAYGIHGLSRRYLDVAAVAAADFGARLRSWWSRSMSFDRWWTIGSFIVVALVVLGWRIYSGSRTQLEDYITDLHLLENYGPAQAQRLGQMQAAASIGQTGWFVLFVLISVVAMTLVLCGVFAGGRAKWGGRLLGLILVLDLARADLPYIVEQDYIQKYDIDPSNRTNSTSAILNFLRDKPYEHRVAVLPFNWPSEMGLFRDLYRIEWAQHQFQYYNIQSLDIVQMPRMPEDLLAYEGALQTDGTTNTMYLVTRRWQLTNTRYLLGPVFFAEGLNQQLMIPPSQRFRIAAAFNVIQRPGVANATMLELFTTEPATNGQYAVLEFTGALPRAKLYSNWHPGTNNSAAAHVWTKVLEQRFRASAPEVADALAHQDSNDQAALFELASASFEPERTVLLANSNPSIPPSVPAIATNENPNAGTVEFTSYAPKKIRLKAKAETPAVLLLNDKYDPSWQVWVDGNRAPLLRCNFIMRGVYLPPGEHTVEFRFEPPIGSLYISCAAVLVGLLLLGYLAMSNRPPKDSSPAPASEPRAPEEKKSANSAAKSSKKRSS
jgi:hypothetical protein